MIKRKGGSKTSRVVEVTQSCGLDNFYFLQAVESHKVVSPPHMETKAKFCLEALDMEERIPFHPMKFIVSELQGDTIDQM